MILARIKNWLALAGAFVLVLVASYFQGRRSGKSAAQNERRRADEAAAKSAREVEDDVSKASSLDIDRRYSRWLRR